MSILFTTQLAGTKDNRQYSLSDPSGLPYLLPAGSGHEVDLVLLLLHPLHVLLQAGHVLLTVGGLEAQELGQTCAVGVVLDHAQLDVGAKLLPELLVVLLLSDLLDHVQGLAHKLLADNLQTPL